MASTSGPDAANVEMTDAEQRVQVQARRYLEDNVVHVLLQGLQTLARERPENPVDYLAMYLLQKNPNKNLTVEVPLNKTSAS
jgi:hypothetical protein